MVASSIPWLRRHLVPAVVVLALLFLSHYDRLYMYGDDVNNVAPGRWFPLPEVGHYIGGRVVDNFFHGFMAESFLRYVAPLLGLEHVVDAHSVFATALFALSSLAVLAALYALVRLFVSLRPVHFVSFSLCAYVFVLGRIEQDGATGIACYTVPLALSLCLLYPSLRLALLGQDAFAGRDERSVGIGMGLLTYLVGFSVTNVELFTLSTQLLCAAVLVVEGSGGPRALARRPAAAIAAFRGLPSWFRSVTVLLPLAVAVALAVDVKTPRYQHEKERLFQQDGFESLSLLDGLASLSLSNGAVLNGVALIAAAGGLLLLVRAARGRSRTSEAGQPSELGERNERVHPLAILSKLAWVLVPTTVAYWLFLVRLSNVGGKDYFRNPGFSAYIVIVVTLPILTALFALTRERRTALLATFLVAVVSLHGMARLNQVPVRPVSKGEIKGLFDSLFMCYAHGEERVPVFLRHAEVGWPHGAGEEGWYLEAYRAVLREQIVGYGARYDPEYRPRMYRVASVEELHAALDKMRAERKLLHPRLEDSPYFIDTGRSAAAE